MVGKVRNKSSEWSCVGIVVGRSRVVVWEGRHLLGGNRLESK